MQQNKFSIDIRQQIVIIITVVMLVPLVALVYDYFYASRTEQGIFLDKERRLEALVSTTNKELTNQLLITKPAASQDSISIMHNTFKNVVDPLVPANTGIRFGFYTPQSDKISISGFLHNYRNLSAREEAMREKEIYESVKSGIVAAQMSKESLFKITGTWEDQVVEYISPLVVDGKVVAVLWAGERLNPIFTQSSYFRKIVRYFIILVFGLGTIGTLLVVRNLINGVNRLQLGLEQMENDIHYQLPTMSGELGLVAAAVNKMAHGLIEKEQLEDQLRRSEHHIALGRLVTGVAHELRNPIGIIKTLVELMKEEYSQVSGIEEFTKAIDEQINRQNSVIQELLDFGRPTKGILKSCSVNELIKGVLSFSAATLRKQKIKVALKLQSALPEIWADAEKLKQVFVNIIINSIEAMPSGGNLTIETNLNQDNIIIRFTDTGFGIPAEETSKVFDPFYTTKNNGTGLGLSISYQNIQLHNGTINASCNPSGGTIFTIKIPVNQSHNKGGKAIDTAHISD